jgi:transposase
MNYLNTFSGFTGFRRGNIMGWAKGHRRKTDVNEKEVQKVISRLERHLDAANHRHGISIRALASELGKSPSTVCRWLKGTDWPSKDDLLNIIKWIG